MLIGPQLNSVGTGAPMLRVVFGEEACVRLYSMTFLLVGSFDILVARTRSIVVRIKYRSTKLDTGFKILLALKWVGSNLGGNR